VAKSYNGEHITIYTSYVLLSTVQQWNKHGGKTKMYIDLSEMENDLIKLCEDNENMADEIRAYFREIEENTYFGLKAKEE